MFEPQHHPLHVQHITWMRQCTPQTYGALKDAHSQQKQDNRSVSVSKLKAGIHYTIFAMIFH